MAITRKKLEELAEIEPTDKIKYVGSDEVKDEKVFITETSNVIIHKLANDLPKMTQEEYEMLKHSILENGQYIPVYFYRGKLVDGRHRLKALKELRKKYIKYTTLPNNWTLNKVKEFVLGTEQRRHETKSQIAVRAYFDYKENGGSMSELAIKYGVDKGDISRAKKIEENLGTDTLRQILKERKVKLQNSRYYSNLKSIVTYINQLKQKVEIKDIEEPKTGYGKQALDYAKKAYINGDLKTLQNLLLNIKKMQDELLIK